MQITENDIKIMVSECLSKILNESALDKEYHYTSVLCLLRIIHDNKIDLSHEPENGRETTDYLSLTRTKNNQMGYGFDIFAKQAQNNGYARIEFDGQKLNNLRSVSIKPFDYFKGHRQDANGIIDPTDYNRKRDETEDSLTFKNGSKIIENPWKYINRIDIMLREGGQYSVGLKNNLIKTINKSPYKDKWLELIKIHGNNNEFNYKK